MVDGVRVRRQPVVYGSRAVALDVEAKLRIELTREAAGMPSASSPGRATNPRLRDLVDEYLKYSRLAHASPQTNAERAKPVMEYFGERQLAAQIRQKDVLAYLSWRRRQKTQYGRRVSPATADRELAFISVVFNHAIRNGLLAEPINPASYVKKANVDNRRSRIITDDEMIRLLDNLSPLHRGIFLAARFTGLRKNHLLALAWPQIGERIIRAPSFDPDRLYESTKRFGAPPIPDGLLDVLPPERKTGPVFRFRGKPIRRIDTITKTAFDAAGIEDAWFHDFRRTYATHLGRLGVDPFVVMTIVGHAPFQQTQIHHRYRIVSIDEILAVGERLARDSSFLRLVDYGTSLAHRDRTTQYYEGAFRRKTA